MDWSFLNSREQSELKFAQVYVDHFEHGTDGHSRLVLIAKLARQLEQMAGEIERLKAEDKQEYMD